MYLERLAAELLRGRDGVHHLIRRRLAHGERGELDASRADLASSANAETWAPSHTRAFSVTTRIMRGLGQCVACGGCVEDYRQRRWRRRDRRACCHRHRRRQRCSRRAGRQRTWPQRWGSTTWTTRSASVPLRTTSLHKQRERVREEGQGHEGGWERVESGHEGGRGAHNREGGIGWGAGMSVSPYRQSRRSRCCQTRTAGLCGRRGRRRSDERGVSCTASELRMLPSSSSRRTAEGRGGGRRRAKGGRLRLGAQAAEPGRRLLPKRRGT